MKTHETKKKRDNLEPFNCYECGKNFERLKYLKAHKKTHNPKPEYVPVSCDYCDKVFSNNRSLNRHIRSIHQRPEVISAW